MATTFWCGLECGALSAGVNNGHFSFASAFCSVSTTITRDSIRSLRLNPSSESGGVYIGWDNMTNVILNFDLRFETLPNIDTFLIAAGFSTGRVGLIYKSATQTLHPACITFANSGSGIAITTGVWYNIDVALDQTAGAKKADLRVDGVAATQATAADFVTPDYVVFGAGPFSGTSSVSGDWYIDNVVGSSTPADYPLPRVRVDAYIPVSDGTHNITTQQFRRGSTATVIDNSTTDAYQLVDDIPFPTGTPSGDDFIAALGDTGPGTDYVEFNIGPAPGVATATSGPLGVSALFNYRAADSATGGARRVVLVDKGTEGVVVSQTNSTAFPGTYSIVRAFFANSPGGQRWNIQETGHGSIKELKARFSSSDGIPDQYFESLILEMAFEVNPPSAPTVDVPSLAAFGLSTTTDNIVNVMGSIPTAPSLILSPAISTVPCEESVGGITITEGQEFPNGLR